MILTWKRSRLQLNHHNAISETQPHPPPTLYGLSAPCLALLLSTFVALSTQVSKPAKKYQPAGGAWRAWSHVHFFGQAGKKPDLASAAVAYREAKQTCSAEYLEAVKLGKLATASKHFSVGKQVGSSSFGARARTLQRSLVRDAKMALLQSSPGESLLQQAAALAEKAELTGMPLSAAVAHARELARAASRLKQAEIAKMEEEVRTFSTGIGLEQLQDIKAIAPQLFHGMSNITAVPSGLGLHIQMQAGNAELVGKAIAWASSAAKKTNLGKSLGQAWSGLHQPILHDDCVDPEDQKTPSPCQLAGRCVCSAYGQNLLAMKRALHRLVKASYSNHMDKQMLLNGMIVIQLSSNNGMDGSSAPQKDIWSHIGLVYQRPYRLTLHELTLCFWHEEASLELSRHVLQALHFKHVHSFTMSFNPIPS
eukprot:6485336-Amphidinium_carterae.2